MQIPKISKKNTKVAVNMVSRTVSRHLGKSGKINQVFLRDAKISKRKGIQDNY